MGAGLLDPRAAAAAVLERASAPRGPRRCRSAAALGRVLAARRGERRRRARASTTRRWTGSRCARPTSPAPPADARVAAAGRRVARRPSLRGAARSRRGDRDLDRRDGPGRRRRGGARRGRGRSTARNCASPLAAAARQGDPARGRGHPRGRHGARARARGSGPPELGVAASTGVAELACARAPRRRGRGDGRRAGPAARAARPGPDPQHERLRAAGAGAGRGRGGRRSVTTVGDDCARDGRGAASARSRGRGGRDRRRVGRAARPREAGARGARRRGGLLGRRAAARASRPCSGPAAETLRFRPARQPGLGDGHLPSVRAAGARAHARRDSARAPRDAAIDADYAKRPGRAHVVRCTLEARDDGWHVRPTKAQGSHVLTSDARRGGAGLSRRGARRRARRRAGGDRDPARTGRSTRTACRSARAASRGCASPAPCAPCPSGSASRATRSSPRRRRGSGRPAAGRRR